jgi:hypothetical protein
MATDISDVIVPEVFNPYVIQRTAELSALRAAGIVSSNPELDRLAALGGIIINMPFWEDLTGADEVLADGGTALTPGGITADKDMARLLMRGRAWSVNDLATALSGDDPMGAIADLVAAYWARREQVTLLAILDGIFAAASMAGNIHDISAEAAAAGVFSANTFIDAKLTLGDAQGRLTAMAVHSQTYGLMLKEDLIEFIRDSQAAMDIPTYMGTRVIVDDGMPVDTGGAEDVYTTYIFGAGAIGMGEGGAPVPTETDRDSLAGVDYLINRRHFILHPRGVAWQESSVAGDSPTNVELATAANWTRVYENKNVRIVKFDHLIAEAA